MCGIAGYHGPRPLPRERIDACLALMRRRGPDHQEARSWTTAHGRHVSLLHSRLSIIDLAERSSQPMQVDDGWIAFNGELYNYIERREELERQGRRLRTRSDTEVLLTAIEHFGWDVLDRCEGMWAFAHFDESTGRLTLSRDRFGEKPLYMMKDADGGLYFGSEIKFLAALSGRRPEIDRNHLWRYLVNGYKALHKTGAGCFFRGIEELPPGLLAHIDEDGRQTRVPYWQKLGIAETEMSFEEAVAGSRERLIRSVELRLRADVPLAFCMSGGVDSVALISIAKRVLGYDVHGFTIVNTDERYEEADMVDTAVSELGVRHTPIPLQTTGFIERLREQVRYHDGPISTITYYAQWLLSEQIGAAGYRISISGTAADELFTGYYEHQNAYLADVAGDAALHAQSLRAWQQHIQPIVRNPYLVRPDLFIADPDCRDYIYLDADEFARYLRFPWSEPFAEERYSAGHLRNRMLNGLFHENIPVILHEEDLNAMYYSIENRSPFLDRPLYDFTNSIPTHHLIRDGKAKAVLREAVRGIAPDAVVDNRRKVGFNAPILDLLDTQNPATRAELLRDSPVFDHVDRDRIAALLERSALPNSQSKFLFYFLNCKIFLEEFGA
jgi:asparagine synthase (glutamine-hydrolysing)